MNFLNKTARNILISIVVLTLAIAMFWVVQGRLSPPQTFQEGATAVPTAEIQQATAISQVSPTATMWPTSAAVPVTTEPYPIFQVTPIPGPTYTPTSTQANLSTLSEDVALFGTPTPLFLTKIQDLENSSFSKPIWSSDGQKLLFEKEIGFASVDQNTLIPQTELWLLNIATDEIKLVAENADRGVFSSDNQKVAYISNASTGSPEIRVLTQSSQDVIDTDVAWRTPIWLDNNTLLYADTSGNLWQTDIEEKSPIPFHSQKIPSDVIQNMAVAFTLSPNADYLLIVTYNSFTLTHLMTGENITLSDIQPNENFLNIVGGIAWSPSGYEIVYTSYNSSGQWINILDVTSNQHTHKIPIETVQFDLPRSFSWSPDGNFLVFSARQIETNNTDIFALNINNEKVVNITNTSESYEDSPNWSPDNSMIVYQKYSGNTSPDLWSIDIQ